MWSARVVSRVIIRTLAPVRSMSRDTRVSDGAGMSPLFSNANARTTAITTPEIKRKRFKFIEGPNPFQPP